MATYYISGKRVDNYQMIYPNAIVRLPDGIKWNTAQKILHRWARSKGWFHTEACTFWGGSDLAIDVDLYRDDLDKWLAK